jgi:hypothetical protein
LFVQSNGVLSLFTILRRNALDIKDDSQFLIETNQLLLAEKIHTSGATKEFLSCIKKLTQKVVEGTAITPEHKQTRLKF